METDGVTVGRSAGYLRGWLIFMLVCILVAAAVAIWAPPGLKLLSLIILMLVPIGVFAYVSSRAERFTLYPDRIEKRGLFTTRSWRLEDIESVSRINEGMVLRMKGRLLPPTLPFYLFKNPEWLAWIETVRNTDFEAFEADLARVDADDVLGGNVEERRQAADRRGSIGRWIGLATFALFLWTIVWPHPDLLPVYICLALPVIALILGTAFPTIFRCTPDMTPTRVNLIMPTALSATALVVPTLPAPVIDWREPALLAAVLGGAVGIITTMVVTGSSARRAWLGLGAAVVGAMYVWGGGLFLNARLADAPATLAEVRVTNSRGVVAANNELTMEVAAAEPFRVTDFRVPSRTFAAHAQGRPVCAIIRSGRFGWRSMEAWPCDEIIRPVPTPAPNPEP